MHSRTFGETGRDVSEVGLGCWQLGGAEWGDVSDDQALSILRSAAESGVTFFDTADIYGGGRSESLIGRYLSETKQHPFVATKLGRSADPGWPLNFDDHTIRAHTEGSLQRLGVEALDLSQLHCIPFDVMKKGDVFETLRNLKKEGKIKDFGASVETVEEAEYCLSVDGLASLQIIFNIFRQKPIIGLLDHARAKGVAIIVRLPLASGLLSGKMDSNTEFIASDHRNFNRDGQAFNVGETFAGIPYAKGLKIVEQLRPYVPGGVTLAQFALRWCLDHPAVTVVIPGATRPEQAADNAVASDMTPLSPDVHSALRILYNEVIHDEIRGA